MFRTRIVGLSGAQTVSHGHSVAISTSQQAPSAPNPALPMNVRWSRLAHKSDAADCTSHPSRRASKQRNPSVSTREQATESIRLDAQAKQDEAMLQQRIWLRSRLKTGTTP
ncbi:MAG: hypothetical protein ACM3ZE_10520 [Myxococcales bacterium]